MLLHAGADINAQDKVQQDDNIFADMQNLVLQRCTIASQGREVSAR